MLVSNTASLAGEFYRQFRESSDGVVFLRALVNSSPLTFETEWREFKPYPHEDPEESIKQIWSKNLSAFANTQGGVLIWGIGTKKVRRVDELAPYNSCQIRTSFGHGCLNSTTKRLTRPSRGSR